jgi:diguanylate cyclase (GGDEF)-like protein
VLSNVDVNEQDRLAALDQYDVLDTPREETFDRITRLACRVFQAPMSTITLIDGHRTWFKSQEGVGPACEAPRASAFCNVTIKATTPLVVLDALADERFKNNPFVVGEPFVRFYAGVPLQTPEGHNIGTLCIVDVKPRAFGEDQIETLIDLARIVMSELQLRRIASTDGLTGALSRRAFKEAASRALGLAVRHRHDVSCIAFDLDHFKRINDSHGHSAGDVVLMESAEICRAQLRKTDFLGRMGGEEFAIFLPHTAAAAALDVAEKLRAAMADHSAIAPAGPIRFSASFGVAALDRFVPDVETLLRRADVALYEAKAHGRNRCSPWQSPETLDPSLQRRVFKAGRIAFNGGRSTIDCTVRGLSDHGASLSVISTAEVPGQFKLRIDSDDLSRLCRVVTKREKRLEVEFA